MKKYDLSQLSAALNRIAEVLERRPISQAALEVWFDALEEFPAERVLPMLAAWPKSHAKFPVPAEVWKALNESGIDEREKRVAAEKYRREREHSQFAATPEGKRTMAQVREILKASKPPPLEHWRNVMRTPGLCNLSHEYAQEYLKKHDPEFSKEREPGQDDEERYAYG